MNANLRRLFNAINGSEAYNIASCAVNRGAENRGIIFHSASFPESGLEKKIIVEKKTRKKKEIIVAEALQKMQCENNMYQIFPKIYQVHQKRRETSIFMEYVEGVESKFLRQEGSVGPLILALLTLSNWSFTPILRPKKITLIFTTLSEILTIASTLKLTCIEKWALLKFMLMSVGAMIRLPVILAHGDLSLQNMAYNKFTQELRFIDFGSLTYSFMGSDLKNLFRCRQLLHFDFYVLTYKYAKASGFRESDLVLSVWLADLRRCSSRIRKAKRRSLADDLVREKKAFKAILTEFDIQGRKKTR